MAPNPSSFTTLGTGGGPVQNPARSQPAHLLMNGTKPVLVDCGEGAIRQLRRAGVEFRDVAEIFLTHHHFDHIGSLFTCLGVNMMTMRKTPLSIYGPPGTQKIVDGLIAASAVPQEIGFGVPGQSLPQIRDFVSVHEIVPGDVVELEGLSVTNCENTHYRPESESGRPGYLSLSYRFDLADRSILFTGDTGACKAVEKLASGVDLLVGEMMDADLTMRKVRTMNPHMPDAAIAKIGKHIAEHHLSAEQLGDLARVAGAKHVVATHLPPGLATPETAPGYIARIAARFAGTVSISEDLQTY
ncbi:MAG: MBL fold metallo-hydrolase [Rhodobacteraceae bacterium]|nr:MBL fold metallo-hydrolase [Paracoccaceae bacterium]